MSWLALGWLLFATLLAGGIGFVGGMMTSGRSMRHVAFWRVVLQGCPPAKRLDLVDAFHRALAEVEPSAFAPPIYPPFDPPPVPVASAKEMGALDGTQCTPCDLWWADWIHGPHLGEACPKCGRPVTKFESRTPPAPNA